MAQYSVIGISGAVDDYIIDTFKMLGVTAEYNGMPDKRLNDSQTAVIVSYGHGGFAYAMTSHFLKNVCNMSPDMFQHWKRHWVGEDDITCKEDITPERWANHVLISYRHIGGKEPLNGLYVELEKRINNDNCPRYELRLEDIVSNPEKALSDIGIILNQNIPINVKEYFLREHKKKKEIMDPWMNTLVLQNKGSRNLTINHFGYIIQLLID